MAKATDRVYEGAEIMDSRDVIEKIEELEALEAEATTEEPDELTKLREMAKDGEGSPDWPHGETLILDSYFEQYAHDLAESVHRLGSRGRRSQAGLHARDLRRDGVLDPGIDEPFGSWAGRVRGASQLPPARRVPT